MPKGLLAFLLILFLSFLFQGCCNSKISEDIEENKIKNSLHVLPLSRGVIEATVSPSKVWYENNFSFCEAMVDKVHNTGGGIRPIAEDVSYKFELNSELAEKIKQIDGTSFRCKISEANSVMDNFNEVNYKILVIIKD